MRAVGDFALLLIQWALFVLGLLIVVIGLLMYQQEVEFRNSLPASVDPTYADSYYIAFSPLNGLRFTTAIGLVAMGLGAVLFYLRRLYLSRA